MISLKALSRAIIPEKMSKFECTVQKLWLILWNLLNDPKKQFFIFCKKRRYTMEKRMISMKSPVFFWSPCKISCQGKVWFIQKWVPSDRNWRVFCDFGCEGWSGFCVANFWLRVSMWFYHYSGERLFNVNSGWYYTRRHSNFLFESSQQQAAYICSLFA